MNKNKLTSRSGRAICKPVNFWSNAVPWWKEDWAIENIPSHEEDVFNYGCREKQNVKKYEEVTAGN